MRKILVAFLLTVIASPALSQPAAGDPPLFTLDEQTWVLFYDLPSRRFRAIRDAFVQRKFDSAGQDLHISAGFIGAESGRAVHELKGPLSEVVARLDELADSIDSPATTASDFDAVFSRAHWLLAQHYLTLAQAARDDKRHRAAGNYLWATAHHMERCVLWSNARLTPKLVRDIERLRNMADALRESEKPERVYRDKPVVSARNTLVEIGEFLNRKIWVAPAAPGSQRR